MAGLREGDIVLLPFGPADARCLFVALAEPSAWERIPQTIPLTATELRDRLLRRSQPAIGSHSVKRLPESFDPRSTVPSSAVEEVLARDPR